MVFVASFNLLPWASTLAPEPGRLLIGNLPNPQEEVKAEARAEAPAEAPADARNATASLAKPAVNVFSAPHAAGSIFGSRRSAVGAAAKPPINGAPSSSIFSGGNKQRQASRVSVMQALPTDLSIEERVLEMQVEYLLESGEGVQAPARSAST